MKISIYKVLLILLIISISENLNAQVGIGTSAPKAALDINSPNQGILLPRVSLNSLTDTVTVQSPEGETPEESTLVYNDGNGSLTDKGFYYWNGTSWEKLGQETQQTYIGKARITASGNLTIAGLPFKPKSISFTAYANVENYDLNSDNGTSNNDSGIANAYGYMKGYARDDSGSIDQQVIYGGGSGNSINDISRYASSTNCIGIRYSNQNGNSLGITSASLTSFNDDGFTLNVNSFADSVVIIYQAYR
ncbi:hypothetical protein GWK08_04545 [Leptobacterium flavescens]|uniref:Uncharacterized protein n=1 Tax=Leptobacterium flavescens TaxID=472055 RepID=A0A6P0ULB7_9FLAO|nr:hypothetical protein [Leptobacterium flavescens]NER12698.1 hypothetical protein [Leptobacterium flavescens]